MMVCSKAVWVEGKKVEFKRFLENMMAFMNGKCRKKVNETRLE